MNCPYCEKEIYAMTGLQELLKFQKHLDKCKKNPKSRMFLNENGLHIEKTTMEDALNIREDSGQ